MKEELSIAGFMSSKSLKAVSLIIFGTFIYFAFVSPLTNVTHLQLINSNKNITIKNNYVDKYKSWDTVFVVKNTKDGNNWEIISESNFSPKDTSYVFYYKNVPYYFTIAKAVITKK